MQATASRSQLITAESNNTGDAATSIASHGRRGTVRAVATTTTSARTAMRTAVIS